MTHRGRGSGWVLPAAVLILLGAVAAYFFLTGTDGARALSIAQVVVGLADIGVAVFLATRSPAPRRYRGYGRSRHRLVALWACVLVMAGLSYGMWWTTSRAGITAAPLRTGALASGQTVTWHPAGTGVRRDRLRFTPRLRNADAAGLCEPSATVTAALVTQGSVVVERTARSGRRIELGLGPGGDAREVRLTLAAARACRLTVEITSAQLVS
ncbi:hypothetical protein [Actinoplanes sp. N902-109]|uniref:hypothetical protein n=1 Tax=Actinoplanes sp. (strain N902-109) TaxID=649831 RepID=UPI00032935F2|nr:hypothetical protein [Actinoplanes sp. N902-109]AGL15605.1 hypothetical protein L083_2095 [Actinoplanes sp. N902-109]